MTIIKTPLQTSEVELSETKNKWWKLVLPLDYKLNYHGRQLNFDKAYLNNIKTAFDENATQEPTYFQLATDSNEHDTQKDKEEGRNYDPERTRGVIDSLEVRESRSDGRNGLWARLVPNSAGASLINENQMLGVSASLREVYPGKDKSYPVVMRHLLGTIDPKVKGMGSWEKDEVALANTEDEDEEVIDLTSTEPTEKETEGETVTVSKEDWDSVLEYVNAKKQEEADADAELEQMANETDNTNLSEVDDPDDKTDIRYIQLSNQVASEQFERRADQWRRDGVPNKIIELARPILSTGESFDVQLSNGNKIDPKAVLAEMIDQTKGYIDLSDQKTSAQAQQDQEDADDQADLVSYFNSF